ncbi:hypothetical protein SCLCIDRAFT_13720 [Scleroderma citrinum Foug A]|uniref:BRCA1-associated protein n=1 Tax=Scleroderma citrinum Foug A TaxID=1036808 RepID=A0A0C3EIC5_9AGAM|nr:hypothetical protein SCLCIDRAFT_13720 [Scleroderma citrinum Foug A]
MKRGYHIRITVYRTVEVSRSHSHTIDTFVPKTLFERLPSHPPRSISRKNALFNSAHKDYRYGPIRIDWTDFDHSSATMVAAGKEKDRAKGPVTATFVPRTKSGSTNLPEGVVHLYRECEQPPDGEKRQSVPSISESDAMPDDGTTLGVLAVPQWMTPSDFLAFVAPAAEGLAHLRLIRDSIPNRCFAIMKFHRPDEALEFAEAYNGKPFNSMEPESCHVVRILSVAIDTEDAVSSTISRKGSPRSSTYELPTCPVCLERMDAAVTGLITVPCSHTFHCMCLSKWGDSRCPVCRYSQTLLSSHPTTSGARSRPVPFSSSSPSMSSCADCSSTTNLWICLICGNIGCGRYGRAHAHAHYQHTTHLYALELETQRVWDYASDGYVHRLIQNKADGKLVELPSAASSMGTNTRDDLGPTHADTLSAEKIEAIGIEYSYLLTSQLDSQRAFYEEQTTQLNSQITELRGMVDKLSRQVEKQRTEAQELESQRRRDEEEKLDSVYREKVKAEKKAEKIAEVARKFEKELKDERAVSAGLLQNLATMKERVEQSEKQREEYDVKITELQDQLRDVMVFLEARSKIEGEGVEAEAAGGSIQLPPPTAIKKKGKKR